MRIDQVLTGVTTPARAAATAERWLVGQLLSIGVIGRVDESSIKLSIDGREVLARTSLDLMPGMRYTARVTAGGAQPQLSIVQAGTDAPPSAPPLSSPAAAAVRNAMVHALPKQEPLDAVLTQLDTRTTSGVVAPAVQSRLVTLTGALPALPTLAQPAALERAVTQAGTLLEATLGAVADDALPALPTQDLKFQLLGLRQAIDDQLLQMPALARAPQAPGASAAAVSTVAAEALTSGAATLRALASDVDAGVARITTHQLQHLAAAERGDLFAFAEIPFRSAAGIDTITLAVESEDPHGPRQGQADQGEGSVALNLAVPLESLGELRARIGLSGDRLAVTLWSEDPALRELIVADIGDLETRLAALGFELTPIALREVAPPDPLRHLPQRLVDTSI